MKPSSYFATLTPEDKGSFPAQVQDLKVRLRGWLNERQLSLANLLMVRVYLTDAANQLDELRRHSLYSHYLSTAGFSYVEQPLLDGAKIALQLWCVDAPGLCKKLTGDGVVAEGEGVRILFQSVRFDAAEVMGLNAEQQTREAFKRHMAWLGKFGMNLKDHCHRTWIFVRDIDRHYAGVVRGRNELFAEEGLTAETHFISSTGIGGYGNNREAVVCMDFLSVKSGTDAGVKYLKAPEYLNPTSEYGVAFERGTALTILGDRYRLISGTASIDKHGECLYRNDVIAQTERLFLNIEQLLGSDGAGLEDMAYMIVYLRDIADSGRVRQYVEKRFPQVPFLITEARVCRPEWLVEVECIACSPLR